MSERANVYVHTEGDLGDILFQMPSLSRVLHEGDVFTATLVGGSAVKYKVESVGYTLVQLASGNTNNPHNFWKAPEVFYGVTVVP